MRSGHPKHFGDAVRERRHRLNLTVDGVKAAGGPTGPTVVRTEAGDLDEPRPSTLAKFDQALRWEPGSAARVFWDGGEPRPRRIVERELEPGSASVPLSLDFVLELMTTHRRLNELVDTAESPAPELISIRSSFNTQVSAVVGMFLTDLLERNAGANGLTHPLLEYAFGELLAAETVDHDEQAAEEKLYRRWLAGKAEQLDPARERKFSARLAASYGPGARA